MKILVDENIPFMTVNELRSKGFDVRDIRGTPKQGITDEEMWQAVKEEKRILITTDKGFSKQKNRVSLKSKTAHGFCTLLHNVDKLSDTQSQIPPPARPLIRKMSD